MRDYEELIQELRTFIYVPAVLQAADVIEELWQCVQYYKDLADNRHMTIQKILEAETKWISMKEPPDNDRNIFICHGTVDSKAPCIGHYNPETKMFYEDKNWFASPICDAMFWCEMPKLPLLEPSKEDDK